MPVSIRLMKLSNFYSLSDSLSDSINTDNSESGKSGIQSRLENELKYSSSFFSRLAAERRLSPIL